MSVPFSYLISDSGNATVFVNGKPYNFNHDDPNYEQVKKAIMEKNGVEIERLANLASTVQNYTGSLVSITNGVVSYKNRPINNSLTQRIIKLMNTGFPFDSMLKFLENLMQNPSKRAVEELYPFLVNRNLPITENGCFLAYKSVRADFLDWHTGKVRNMVGDVVEMERNEVDEEWRVACGSGYHIGSLEYLANFHQNEGHIIIVECNPKDVVSVPSTEVTKCRTCKYTVVGEMDGELVAQLYKTTANTFEPVAPSDSDSNEYSRPTYMYNEEEEDEEEEFEDEEDEDEEWDSDTEDE